MSQLIVMNHGRKFKLNVTQFRSPMSASINTVQTKTMLQHFPIRAGQPDINFTVRFNSQNSKHEFQNFVRDHQVSTRTEDGDLASAVTLWWPERNIENWTGYIVEFRVVERGFKEPAPSVTFGVALVDSLMSERTRMSSFGSFWTSIWGPQIPPYQGPGPLLNDNLIRPPTPPASQSPVPVDVTPPNPPSPFGGGR